MRRPTLIVSLQLVGGSWASSEGRISAGIQPRRGLDFSTKNRSLESRADLNPFGSFTKNVGPRGRGKKGRVLAIQPPLVLVPRSQEPVARVGCETFIRGPNEILPGEVSRVRETWASPGLDDLLNPCHPWLVLVHLLKPRLRAQNKLPPGPSSRTSRTVRADLSGRTLSRPGPWGVATRTAPPPAGGRKRSARPSALVPPRNHVSVEQHRAHGHRQAVRISPFSVGSRECAWRGLYRGCDWIIE